MQFLHHLIIFGAIAASTAKELSVHVPAALASKIRVEVHENDDQPSSFSGIDYLLLGYNVLRGYPQAIGHDKGFTLPIFEADYKSGNLTADGRHIVPQGVSAVSDVACETSFSSKEVKSQQELARSLSVDASVHASGWGAKFSASVKYKDNMHSLSNGQSILIFSSAECQSYYARLDVIEPPKLHHSFVKYLQGLLKVDPIDEAKAYYKFFDDYGTHFFTDMNFGSKFIYQHKMSSDEYKKQSGKQFSISAQASYSGLFSAGGSFKMDQDEREAASEFSKSVETDTITVGAPPPASGDAMKWASTVKENPMPMKYKMQSIESLASMIKENDLDIGRFGEKVQKYKTSYCQYLKETTGEVADCKELNDLSNDYETYYGEVCEQHVSGYIGVNIMSDGECIKLCEEDPLCAAAVYRSEWNYCMLQVTCYGSVSAPGYNKYISKKWRSGIESLVRPYEDLHCPSQTWLPQHAHMRYLDECIQKCAWVGQGDGSPAVASGCSGCIHYPEKAGTSLEYQFVKHCPANERVPAVGKTYYMYQPEENFYYTAYETLQDKLCEGTFSKSHWEDGFTFDNIWFCYKACTSSPNCAACTSKIIDGTAKLFLVNKCDNPIDAKGSVAIRKKNRL